MLDLLMTLLGRSSAVRPPPPSVVPAARQVPDGEPFLRQSNGLDQFFGAIRDRSALSILDFARASQANVSFITNMSHSISSQNFMYSLETIFGDDDFFANQSDSRLVGEFVQESLNFPPDRYDGGLIWDSLQFLTPQLLQLAVDRLYETLRPGSYLLAFFHANEKAREIPIYHYAIHDHKTLRLTPRGLRPQAQFFNNRALEKLFQRFQSVKFFLTRDNLREIIVRR